MRRFCCMWRLWFFESRRTRRYSDFAKNCNCLVGLEPVLNRGFRGRDWISRKMESRSARKHMDGAKNVID
jgi:hypothetical protein